MIININESITKDKNNFGKLLSQRTITTRLIVI